MTNVCGVCMDPFKKTKKMVADSNKDASMRCGKHEVVCPIAECGKSACAECIFSWNTSTTSKEFIPSRYDSLTKAIKTKKPEDEETQASSSLFPVCLFCKAEWDLDFTVNSLCSGGKGNKSAIMNLYSLSKRIESRIASYVVAREKTNITQLDYEEVYSIRDIQNYIAVFENVKAAIYLESVNVSKFSSSLNLNTLENRLIFDLEHTFGNDSAKWIQDISGIRADRFFNHKTVFEILKKTEMSYRNVVLPAGPEDATTEYKKTSDIIDNVCFQRLRKLQRSQVSENIEYIILTPESIIFDACVPEADNSKSIHEIVSLYEEAMASVESVTRIHTTENVIEPIPEDSMFSPLSLVGLNMALSHNDSILSSLMEHFNITTLTYMNPIDPRTKMFYQYIVISVSGGKNVIGSPVCLKIATKTLSNRRLSIDLLTLREYVSGLYERIKLKYYTLRRNETTFSDTFEDARGGSSLSCSSKMAWSVQCPSSNCSNGVVFISFSDISVCVNAVTDSADDILHELHNLTDLSVELELLKSVEKFVTTISRETNLTSKACSLCKTKICIFCKMDTSSEEGDKHQCNPDTISTNIVMASETKPCPRCSAPIYKLEGCSDMYCTRCRTCFHWRTMEIVKKNTNPLFQATRLTGNSEIDMNEVNMGVIGLPISQDNLLIRAGTIAGEAVLNNLLILKTLCVEKKIVFANHDLPASLSSMFECFNKVMIDTLCPYQVPGSTNRTNITYVMSRMRIIYLLEMITESSWVRKVTRLETTTICFQELLRILSSLVEGVLSNVREYTPGDESLSKAINTTVKEANSNFKCVFNLLRMIGVFDLSTNIKRRVKSQIDEKRMRSLYGAGSTTRGIYKYGSWDFLESMDDRQIVRYANNSYTLTYNESIGTSINGPIDEKYELGWTPVKLSKFSSDIAFSESLSKHRKRDDGGKLRKNKLIDSENFPLPPDVIMEDFKKFSSAGIPDIIKATLSVDTTGRITGRVSMCMNSLMELFEGV